MPIINGGGGGQKAQTSREQISGATLLINNGATASLPWSVKSGGDTLLDISTPAAPTIITAGVYAFSAIVFVTTESMTVGGSYALFFSVDVSGDGAAVLATAPPSVAAARQPVTAVAMTYYVPAGGGIDLEVTNNDGVQNVHFNLAVQIQRIS